MADCVVRFAPSPSGYLHIGGARTAIFNWLFARKHGGKFIVRIEDTDAERSSEASVRGILDGLQWLGLQWDEGPFFQSRFKEDHLSAARQLIADGHAYKCFCRKADLESRREKARREKRTYLYDGACRNLSPTEVQAREAAGVEFAIRMKVPRGEGAVVFDDRVYGRIEKRHADLEDFVLVRTGGEPLYVLANAVDDIRDGITHVIRGQDGLANTPKQVLIYRGLGKPLPVFAHMSLTLDPLKAKISKRRHGEQVAIHYYRELGFLPWAMVNFLVRLGWSTDDSRDFFDLPELLAAFDLPGINRTNSIFNIRPDDSKFITDPKLLSINAHYLRTMPIDQLLPQVRARLTAAGLWDPAFDGVRRTWLAQTVALIRQRFHLLSDFATLGRPYFSDEFDLDPVALTGLADAGHPATSWLTALADALCGVDSFDHDTVEALLRAFLREWRIKPGILVNGIRMALTGHTVGPEIIQVICCLGQGRSVDRLRRAVTMMGA